MAVRWFGRNSYHDIVLVHSADLLVVRARKTRVASHLTAEPHEVPIDSSASREGEITSTFKGG